MLGMSQQRIAPNALWPGNKEIQKWNLTGRLTASSLKVNTHKKAAGLLLAVLEMAEHFNHGVNSLCSKSERRQTSKTERSATCNQFQIDRQNQSNSIQEARNQTSNKAKFKEWRLERRSDIQQSNKHWKYTRRVKMVGGTQVLLIRVRQDFKNGGGQQRERVEARTISKRKSNRGTGTAWAQRVIEHFWVLSRCSKFFFTCAWIQKALSTDQQCGRCSHQRTSSNREFTEVSKDLQWILRSVFYIKNTKQILNFFEIFMAGNFSLEKVINSWVNLMEAAWWI